MACCKPPCQAARVGAGSYCLSLRPTRAGPITKGNIMADEPYKATKHIKALRELQESLLQYIHEGGASGRSGPLEEIDDGHYVHDAVEAAQAFYPPANMLPWEPPWEPLIVWKDLLDISRGERQTDRPNQEAMKAAGKLVQWAEAEIKTLCGGDGGQPADGNKPERKQTVNERMIAKMASDLETVKGWTAQNWADHLDCGCTTVKDTKTWKSLSLLRQQVKAEQREDRRRRMAKRGANPD